MILEALEQTAHLVLIAAVVVCLACLVLVAIASAYRAYLVRDEARRDRAYREQLAARDLRLAQIRSDVRERQRSEMRSYNARPTASERWGGLV